MWPASLAAALPQILVRCWPAEVKLPSQFVSPVPSILPPALWIQSKQQWLSASSCSGRAAAANAVAPACPLPTGLASGDGPAAATLPPGPRAPGRPMNTPGGPAPARGRIGSASASQPPARSFPRLVCGWGLDISRVARHAAEPFCPFPLPPVLLERRCSSPAAPARPAWAAAWLFPPVKTQAAPRASRLLSWLPAPRH